MGLQLISSYFALTTYVGVIGVVPLVDVGLLLTNGVVVNGAGEQVTMSCDNRSTVNLRYLGRLERRLALSLVFSSCPKISRMESTMLFPLIPSGVSIISCIIVVMGSSILLMLIEIRIYLEQ
jgi:hypothetical protein